MKRGIGIPLLFLTVLLPSVQSCSFATAHQSPALLNRGESAVRYGGSLGGFYQVDRSDGDEFEPSAGIPLMFLEGRWNLDENLEFGIRSAGLPYVGMMAGDLKYLLTERPVLVAADLGVTVDRFQLLGVHPTILVGSESLYGGIEQSFYLPYTSKEKRRYNRGDVDPPISALIVGSILGDRVKFMPELRLLSTRHHGIVLSAMLGLRWERPKRSPDNSH